MFFDSGLNISASFALQTVNKMLKVPRQTGIFELIINVLFCDVEVVLFYKLMISVNFSLFL